jgi:short-subunit dehydrogenase
MIDINLNGVIYGSKLALERFLPRGRGHLVNIASVAGKAGFPGGATYCATKHAVVGLSEAIRAEVRPTNIDVSIVMPVVVNTELGSGLQKSRGVKVVEPEDVANAIVEALQTGRVDVYIPRSVQGLFRFMYVVPRGAADFISKVLKGDQVLVNPDHMLRGAYEQRTGDSSLAPIAEPVAAAEPQPAEAAEPEPEKQAV